jgi:hypothetical protein
MISDTFVPAPADVISRIGMIGTAFLLWVVQRFYIFYSSVTPGGTTTCDRFNAWIGTLGALGLMVVAAYVFSFFSFPLSSSFIFLFGCSLSTAFFFLSSFSCNEDENGTIHGTGAGFFFVGQLIMMIGFTKKAYEIAHSGNPTTSIRDAHAKLITTVIAFAFGIMFLYFSSDWGKWGNQIAQCEWGAVFMIFFFNASALPEYSSSFFAGEIYYPAANATSLESALVEPSNGENKVDSQ